MAPAQGYTYVYMYIFVLIEREREREMDELTALCALRAKTDRTLRLRSAQAPDPRRRGGEAKQHIQIYLNMYIYIHIYIHRE